jgi:hypothetical protein
MHRVTLINDSDFTIIATYQAEYRGMVNYYRLAYNLSEMSHLKWTMETSLTKTLARKLKITVAQVYQKYQTELEADGTIYKGLQVVIPREGKKPLRATWGGVPLKWDIRANLEDQIGCIRGGRTELEKRLLAQECELCGATDQIEVHVRRFGGRDRAHQMV